MKTTTKKKSKVKENTHEIPPRLQSEIATTNLIKTEEVFTTVKHLANMGDIVASMAACKKYWEITGRKIMFCQYVDHPAAYYPGATHGTTDDNGTMVTLNKKMFEMIKPLVESQPYIHSFVRYEGQRIDLDFDVIRGKTDVNMPHGMLPAWIMYAYPDLWTDLSKPWIELPEREPTDLERYVSNKVIINFTERYRSHAPLDYYFLKGYAPDLVFAGTEKEHWLFCNRWQLPIKRLEPSNFLEMAYAIKACRFLLSNQSFLWNTADAMKTPRVLEVCKWADNCQPGIGGDSVGYYYQTGCEYHFRTMYNKTQNK